MQVNPSKVNCNLCSINWLKKPVLERSQKLGNPLLDFLVGKHFLQKPPSGAQVRGEQQALPVSAPESSSSTDHACSFQNMRQTWTIWMERLSFLWLLAYEQVHGTVKLSPHFNMEVTK